MHEVAFLDAAVGLVTPRTGKVVVFVFTSEELEAFIAREGAKSSSGRQPRCPGFSAAKGGALLTFLRQSKHRALVGEEIYSAQLKRLCAGGVLVRHGRVQFAPRGGHLASLTARRSEIRGPG